MKKDILFPEVVNVMIAIVPEINAQAEKEWKVYIINRKNEKIENVMITSSGYGMVGDEMRKSSVLRHFLGDINPNSAVLIEPIDPSVFVLNNEYWISYYYKNQLFDKKYIFLADSIVEENLIHIAELDLKGILHI